MNKNGLLKAALFGLLLCLPLCSALIENLEVDNDDRTAFHIRSFGFEVGGRVELVVQDFTLMVSHDYQKPADQKYKIAFVLQKSQSDGAVRVDETSADACFHETMVGDEDILISLESRTNWKRLEFSHTITSPGYYHLYFSNCEQKTAVTFSLTLSEYNVDEMGSKNFLSAGQSILPLFYFIICGLFVAAGVIWAQFLIRNRTQIKSIHHLMTAVLVLKVITLLFESLRFHSLKTTGLHDGWSIAYYVFSFLKGMMMFATIVLIGTGWSYLKPFLSERDKTIMLAVLVVQAMVNVADVVVDESSPGSAGWLTWSDILHLLDVVCCCVVLLPIVASIRHLKSAANVDGKTQRNLARLSSFRTFYLLVVSYIYFTRIIVYLLTATLPFEWAWFSTLCSEGAALVFYTLTGYLFRPQPNNPYFLIDQEDDDQGDVRAATAAAAEAEMVTIHQ